MIAVIGSFRIPPERVEEALPIMRKVIEDTLQEDGCNAYSYAQHVSDPGLFQVAEMWTDREALEKHFQTPHMLAWVEDRAALGFHDRRINVFPLGVGEEI